MVDRIPIVEMEHSPLGPSASERWLNCPGSVLASRGHEKPTTIFAAEGNAAHELSEWCRVQEKPASHWRGKTIVVGEFEFEVDAEMIEAVDEFVEYVEQWPGDPLIEERVDYGLWVPNGFGTLDDGRLQDKTVYITDLKFGQGIQVFADDNPQLKLYALGVYQDFGHLYDIEDFVLTIHQPRLNHVDTFRVDTETLLTWADDVVRPIAESALKPNAAIVAGDHCVFCPLREVCKVRAEYLTRIAFEDFQDLDAGTKETLFLTNDDVAKLLPHLDNVKKWCNDLESYALGELSKGNAVGDYKVVAGRANRVFTDEKAAIKALTKLGGAYEQKLLSPAQAEKKYGKKKVGHLIMKPQGKPTLAPAKDKRETLVIDAATEFDSLEG